MTSTMTTIRTASCFVHLFVIACFVRLNRTSGCTNVIVTPAASEDGSAMLAYNTDDSELFGVLFHYPAKTTDTTTAPTTTRYIYAWETGRLLGVIPEAKVTYNVIGNCNDQGLCIGETTFDGIEQLVEPHPDSIVDYGSLMWIALQRSGTAREAMHTMAELMEKYGYASSGESFSIVDAEEGWVMDVISKGQYELGAVWVAVRIPDGHVAVHANQARITTFPWDDPENCIFAEDVVDFARGLGLYDGKTVDFNFSEIYDKKPASKVRYAEARVWFVFTTLLGSDFGSKYLEYAKGLDSTNTMPLSVEPRSKVALDDVRAIMSSHYEGTALQYDNQVGSGIFEAPYRPRPYTWNLGEKLYVNERNIGVEKTGINFIAQIRGWMPPPLSALLWFAVDDASTAPRFPAYACSTRVSEAYRGLGSAQGHVQPVMNFDMQKAFWVQNMVSNLVYSRWRDAFPILKFKLDEVQENFVGEAKKMDDEALHLYRTIGRDAAIEKLTKFSVEAADNLHSQWTDFYGHLFVRFRDLVTTEEDTTNLVCGCKTTEVGLTKSWRERIVSETGLHYQVDDDNAGTNGAVDGEEWRGRQRHTGGWVFVACTVLVLLGLLLLRKNIHRDRKRKLERAVSMEEHTEHTLLATQVK